MEITFFDPLNHGKYFLKAETTGKVESTIPLNINVCGYEDIKVAREKYYQVLVQDFEKAEVVDLATLFESNEADCPIISYKLIFA